MAKRLERWTCDSEAPSSSPTLTASRIRSPVVLSSNSRPRLFKKIYILLTCLLLVGFLSHVMFTTIVPGKPNGNLKRC